MNLVPIGIGSAGNEVVDKLLEYQTLTDQPFIDEPVIVDSAMENLLTTERVPPDNRVVVGQSYKGHDDELKPEHGAEIVNAGLEPIQGAIDNAAIDAVDAFLVIAHIGSALGSGGAPVLSNHLSEVYSKPVLGSAVLPKAGAPVSELDNAARSFGLFTEHVDQLLSFDPEMVTVSTDRSRHGATGLAEENAKRLGFLFSTALSGGEDHPIDSHNTSKLLTSLSGDGFSSFGYATESIQQPWTLRFASIIFGLEESVINADQITSHLESLVRQATREAQAVSDPPEEPDGGIVIIGGPPSVPQVAVDRSRAWLGEELGESDISVITHGVPRTNSMAVAVVLAGLGRHDRLDEDMDSRQGDEALEAILSES